MHIADNDMVNGSNSRNNALYQHQKHPEFLIPQTNKHTHTLEFNSTQILNIYIFLVCRSQHSTLLLKYTHSNVEIALSLEKPNRIFGNWSGDNADQAQNK